MSCNNVGGCSGSGASCNARVEGAAQTTSVGSSLVLLAFVSYRLRKRNLVLLSNDSSSRSRIWVNGSRFVVNRERPIGCPSEGCRESDGMSAWPRRIRTGPERVRLPFSRFDVEALGVGRRRPCTDRRCGPAAKKAPMTRQLLAALSHDGHARAFLDQPRREIAMRAAMIALETAAHRLAHLGGRRGRAR